MDNEELEIMQKFINIDENNSSTNIGKYPSKKETFFEDVEKWREDKIGKGHDIRPIQFTFEITNRCNCDCKDCGMSANSIKNGKTKLNRDELYKLANDLNECGIPAIGITGGEPFLEFDNMCKLIEYTKNKLDIAKIVSNGFWGKEVENYFKRLEEVGFFENNFFVPSLQISIGEQTVPLEHICNIINYICTNYKIEKLSFGIIHAREEGVNPSKLLQLYNVYVEKFGEFPINRIYLTDIYYAKSHRDKTGNINTPQMPIYDSISFTDNCFKDQAGKVVSPKIFMKCNGDCYPCEIFNLHENLFLGNYFEDGLPKIIENLNTNKYVRFIKKYGTISFKEVIPEKVLKQNYCESSCCCFGCEFCIKFCEENNLIR